MKYLKPLALIAGGIITGCILMIFMKDGKIPLFTTQPSDEKVLADEGHASQDVVESNESLTEEEESDSDYAAENLYEDEDGNVFTFGDFDDGNTEVDADAYDSSEGTEMIDLIDEKNNLSIRTPKDGFHFYKRAEVKKPTNTIEEKTWKHPDFYTNTNFSGKLSFIHGEPYNLAILKQNYNPSVSIDEALSNVYYHHEMMKEHSNWSIRPTLTDQYDYPLFEKVRYLYRITTAFDTFYEGAFASGTQLYIFSIRVDEDTWLDDPIMEEYWTMLNTLQTAN